MEEDKGTLVKMVWLCVVWYGSWVHNTCGVMAKWCGGAIDKDDDMCSVLIME